MKKDLGKSLGGLMKDLVEEQNQSHVHKSAAPGRSGQSLASSPPASSASQRSESARSELAPASYKHTLNGVLPRLRDEQKKSFVPRTDLIVPLSRLDLDRCTTDFEYYAANLLKIKTVDAELRPFVFNHPQQRLYRVLKKLEDSGRLKRIIVLKARREGISTFTEGLIFHAAHMNENTETVVISHEKDSGAKIFAMCRLFYDCLPPKLRPMTKYDSKKELVFANPDKKSSDYNPGLRSSIEVVTAGKKDVARSAGYHLLHCCFGPNILIMDDRWTPREISTVRPGDRLRTPDGGNAQVVNIFKYENQDTGIEISLWGSPSDVLLSTREHKYPTSNGMKKAEEISLDDYMLYPVNDITDEIKYINLQNLIVVSTRPQGGGYTPRPKADYIDVTRSLGYFFGLFLAEGSFGAYSSGKTTLGLPNRVTLTIHEKEVQEILPRLSFLQEYFSCSPSVCTRPESKAVNIQIDGAILARFMYSIFGPDKHIPEFFYSCGSQFLGGIVEGYIYGDGGQDKYCDKISISSVRPHLLYWLRDVLVRLRIGWSSISSKEAGEYYGRNCRKSWTLTISGETFHLLQPNVGTSALFQGKPSVQKWRWSDDYSYIQIKIKDIKEKHCFDVVDLEIGTEDHLYLTNSCITSNSEVASWPFASEVVSSLVPTIPKTPKSLIVYESTAKGIGNFFHQEWERAENGDSNFIPFFLSWFDMQEYSHNFYSAIEKEQFLDKLNEEEQELMVNFQLTPEQLYWRRLTIADLKGDAELFRQEYPSTAEEAFIVSGIPVFDRKKLRIMAQKAKEPLFRGEVGEKSLLPNESGRLKVWQHPQRGQVYSLGVDVADGGEGGDYSCIEVWKKLPHPYTAEQVAEWHGHLDPYNLAHVASHLGRYYHEALIGVETNAHGLATLNELQRTYWNLYRQEHFDRYKNARVNKLGWETTNRSKKLLISFTTHCIQDLSIIVHSHSLIRECMTFLRNAQGTADAENGGHDDRVMSAMIGLFCMHQQLDEPESDGSNDKMSSADFKIDIPKSHIIDPDFGYILEYGSQDTYAQSWMDY